MDSIKNKKLYFKGAVNNMGTLFQGSTIETVNFVVSEETSEKVAACMRALGQTDPRNDRSKLETYNPHIMDGMCCQWILQDDLFQRWISDGSLEQSLIWICDRPLMGKTTLAVFISEHLEQSGSPDGEAWVLYYFCNNEDESHNAAAEILKSFMHQLYRKYPPLGSIVYEEYRLTGDALFQPRQIEALWRMFEAMIDASPARRIFCIIDGADQCHEKELDHLLRKVSKYFKDHGKNHAADVVQEAQSTPPSVDHSSTPASSQQHRPELRAIILSREVPDCVARELSSFPRLSLKSYAPREEDSDLRRFVEAKVERVSTGLAGNKTSNTETNDLVASALSGWENQSFAWVDLIAETLINMKKGQVKKFVQQGPPASEQEIRAQTLLQIPSRQRPNVAAILKWVALAVRPLTPLELTKAVKYFVKTAFNRRALNKAISLCPGLVEIRGNKKRKEVVLKDDLVRQLLFSDQSVLRQIKELEVFVLVKSNVHSELANACIAYLQGSANLGKSRRVRLKPSDELRGENASFFQKHPFLEYAMVNWTFHARHGNIEMTDYGSAFFKDDSPRRRLWWESYWISLRQTFAWKWTAPGRFSLLHLAAFFGILPLAEYLLSKDRIENLLNAEDHQGMKPINWATDRSQAVMVRFLLERGDFDEEALRQAARTGDISIIELLLANREGLLRSPSVVSGKSSPATPSSPFQSFDSMRKVTLSSISELQKRFDQPKDQKAPALSPGVKGYGKATSESVLHIAATCGHDEAVRIFLKYGEDIEKATDGGWTALHNAAWFGRVPIIQRLVKAGADVNRRTKELLTPLHCSVKNSHPTAVECLLGIRSVEIDAKDQNGLTPFHMACRSNNTAIMEILLQHGVDVEQRMPLGWTPLMWACVNGQRSVVEFLLDHGADVTTTWIKASAEPGQTVEVGLVALAKTYGQPAVAKLVENYGAARADALNADDANALLPPEVVEEAYDLPVVEDIVVVNEEDAGTDDIENVAESESSPESDDESDIGDGIHNDDEDLKRKLSENMVSEVAPHVDIDSHSPIGLGIREGDDSNVATERETGQEVAAEDSHSSIAVDTGEVEAKVGITPSDQAHSLGEKSATSPAPLQGIAMDVQPIGTEIESGTRAPTEDPASEALPISSPKSPRSLSNRLSRFVPTKAVSRTKSSTGEEKAGALSTTSEREPEIDGVNASGTQNGADNVALDTSVASSGVRWRFPKYALGWRNEASDVAKRMLGSPTEDQGQHDTPPETRASSERETIPTEQAVNGGEGDQPDQQSSQDVPDPVGDENSPSLDKVTPSESKPKSNLFSSKRVRNWKRGSDDKGATKTAAGDVPEPMSAQTETLVEAATATSPLGSPPELREMDLAERVDSVGSVSSPKVVAEERGSQPGRTFFSKAPFGKKKPSTSE